MTTAHEPRRGPGTHLSTEDLSALAEGAQPGAEGAQAHLRDCPECRAEVDAISELLAAFAEFEAPALPQEVAIRIDAALVREAAARAAPSPASQSTDSAGEGAASERREPSPVRKRRVISRGLGWGLASLALVAGGLTLLVNLASSTSVGGAASTSAAGKAPGYPAPRNTIGPLAESQYGAAAPQTLSAAAPLAVWVKELLPTRAAGSSTTPRADTPVSSSCLADPRFAANQALAAADNTFEGTAATVVVYPNGSDASTVLAVVYAAPCTSSSYRILAEGIVVR